MGFTKLLHELTAVLALPQAARWIVGVIKKFTNQNVTIINPIWLRLLVKPWVSSDKDFACVRHVDHVLGSIKLLHVEAEEIQKNLGR